MGVSNKKKFGQFLFDLRMKHGLTLTEIGKRIGISTNYASELERGKKEASDEVVRKIATVYNMQEETLFAMMGRVPLGIKEETENSPELQELLSEIAKNKNLSEDAKKKVYQKVRKYYESLLEDI
jgi:transcriptional regulator with XRE-family HTH domain